jgi:hypothetical protein
MPDLVGILRMVVDHFRRYKQTLKTGRANQHSSAAVNSATRRVPGTMPHMNDWSLKAELKAP